jgi:toxin FitB
VQQTVLDTSVLIGDHPLPPRLELSISVVSIAELHFGLLLAKDEDARAERMERLGLIEARFPDPIPVDDRVARAWGHLQAAVARRGGNPAAASPTSRSPQPQGSGKRCCSPRMQRI